MSKKIKAVSLFIFVFALSLSAFSQNKFEGYNIILNVPTTQRAQACAIRYAPPTTAITITDLNASTPLDLKACAGSGTSLTGAGNLRATMRANRSTFKWCFEGEDEKYRITFGGDSYSGEVSYDWIATPEEPGFYNIKQFGAVGDGRTDDTLAIQSALAFIATRNGGTLRFPEGEYIVGGQTDFQGITLPTGVIIEGISGIQTGAATNNVKRENPSRITLRGTNRAIFRIGECTEKISIKNLELNAESSVNTYGIEAVGAYTSSQGLNIDNVVFNKFFRGIYAYGLPITSQQWQFDYIKINQSRFVYNTDAGIYTNIRNSDWKISSSLFINPRRTATQRANSMHFERVTAVLIQDTFGGGFQGAEGGTFINILDSGIITVIGSQTEKMTKSLVYNEEENQYAGDYTYPITFVNNVFGNPIEFKARRTFVSTGNFYLGDTFKADERLRVYSTGDRFCYDGFIVPGCQGADLKYFDRATVIFMTGQPGERSIPDRPTYFGTDVQFGAPVQMPSFRQNQLPPNKPNGSMVYCTDCRRDTEPCRGGGNGSPAMVVNGSWSCL